MQLDPQLILPFLMPLLKDLRQDGPTVVAGHSYGGQIMTALGTDAPNVAAMVYIAAFGLDEGESIGDLLAQGGPTQRWPTWTSMSWATRGCPRTTSWAISPLTWTRPRLGCCSRRSRRWPRAPCRT